MNCLPEYRNECPVYNDKATEKPCWILNKSKNGILHVCKGCPYYLKNNVKIDK